jgi:ribosomal protein S18 acetylase RimI-like enzyme
MTLHNRPFESEADYEYMRALLVDSLGRAGLPVYATIGDIDWWRSADEDPRAVYMARLWFDDERPVAWAWPVDDQVDIVVHPDYPALHDAALAWAEAEYEQRQGAMPEKPMRAWSFTGDATRIAALIARGYRPTEDGGVLFSQSITATTPPPTLPPGYRFDHVRGAADIPRRVAVQRAAFESEFMTEAIARAVQASPTYQPELDLVIVAPDESFAAFALIWLDDANHVGVFEPLGVAAAHWRRGLGRALLAEGLRRLAIRGARIACVGTGLDNHRARGLYEAAGFTELDRNFAWIRPPH